MENLTSLQQFALNKFKPAKTARNELAPGTYEVDFTVRIKGTVTVGEDTTRASTVSLLSLKTVALILHYAGVTRSAALKAITRAFQDINGDLLPTASVELSEDVKKIHDKIKKDLASDLPRTPVKGQVKAKCSYDII